MVLVRDTVGFDGAVQPAGHLAVPVVVADVSHVASRWHKNLKAICSHLLATAHTMPQTPRKSTRGEIIVRGLIMRRHLLAAAILSLGAALVIKKASAHHVNLDFAPI